MDLTPIELVYLTVLSRGERPVHSNEAQLADDLQSRGYVLVSDSSVTLLPKGFCALKCAENVAAAHQLRGVLGDYYIRATIRGVSVELMPDVVVNLSRTADGWAVTSRLCAKPGMELRLMDAIKNMIVMGHITLESEH